MTEPESRRPYMPAYIGADAGGTLPWSWAEARLTDSHCYWVATVWPGGQPHVTPVWGVWLDGCLWFSCDLQSRKGKNLAADPRCAVTTEDPLEPVVVDGLAAVVLDRRETIRFTDAVRTKYADEWVEDVYTVDFFDANLGGGATYRVTPASVFGLDEKAFATSPTRWTF